MEDEKTTKEIKQSDIGKKSRKIIKSLSYIYLYQNNNTIYDFSEYWPKNRVRNLILMKRGLANRIHPLNLLKQDKPEKKETFEALFLANDSQESKSKNLS